MATRIYVTSAEGGTGKSTIAVGLLETLKGSVARVGVFRPISRSGPERDYVLEMLLEHASATLEYEACVGTSYREVHENPDAALAQILDRFGAMENECDAVVILLRLHRCRVADRARHQRANRGQSRRSGAARPGRPLRER